jgi:NADPH:quinone reductase-like Zn-dependent oxidoreductase
MGSWQEYVVISEALALPVPEELTDEAACQAIVNPVTAFGLLHELNLAEGEWLLLTAAGSTLGQMLITLAKLRGLRVICTVRRDEQIPVLKSLGAEEVINTAKADLTAYVEAIAGHKGVPAVLEAVGGEVGAKALHCLGNNGKFIAYGLLSGEPTPVAHESLIFQGVTIKGFWLIEWLKQAKPELLEGARKELLGLLADGRLPAPVEAKYDLGEVREAIAHAKKPDRAGKVLLVG